MKSKIILLIIIHLLIIGIQDGIAQNFANKLDSHEEVYQNASTPPSSVSLSSEIERYGDSSNNISKAPKWGGSDAPDPEGGDESTSGAAPISDGTFVLLLLIGVYTITMCYRKVERRKK